MDCVEVLKLTGTTNFPRFVQSVEAIPFSEEHLNIAPYQNALKLTDTVTFPPPITFTGRVVLAPDVPGIEPLPIADATVVVYYAGTDIIVAKTKTDSDGFYRITDLPSEKEYELKIFKDGYISVTGRVFAHDKDIVEERARMAIESETYAVAGESYYYEVVISFPWLFPVPEGGRIYGYIYNRKTLERIEDVLVTAVNVDTGNEYYTLSDENGNYSIFVERGNYKLSATKFGFHPSEVFHGTISSNWNQNIPLDPIIKAVGLRYHRVGLRHVPSY